MDKEHHQPLSGNEMPRFAGPGTMFRLPAQSSPHELDACFVGVPMDIGTSNRPPYDPSGNTALLGANLLYELLCVLPGTERQD